MASSTGSAAVAQTSRDFSLAFAANQERDAGLRRKMEFLQAEVERQKMANAEMETRSVLQKEKENRIVWDLLDEEEARLEALEVQNELREQLARVSRERDRTVMTLLAEARDLRVELRAASAREVAPARIL